VTDPGRTYAVVVGIERYEAGAAWNLDGAADTALRITGWLRSRGVPAGNITVLLSPLEHNRAKSEQTLADQGFTTAALPATVDNVRRVITEELPARQGDLLVLFWSGHGVLDSLLKRRLFCANAGVNVKYHITVEGMLAALSGSNFSGLREQVVIIDSCANFIQEMRLNLEAGESGFNTGAVRAVSRSALLAAAQGERAVLDPEKSFGPLVADWLDEHAAALPPAMDLLAGDMVRRFKELRAAGFTAQHPVRLQQMLHGEELTDVFGREPVPEEAQLAARRYGLTTAQLRVMAAAIAGTPQLAVRRRLDALLTAMEPVAGRIAPSGDQEADLLDLFSAVLAKQATPKLFGELLALAVSDAERTAVVGVRHRWELQLAVVPLLGLLRRTSVIDVLGALSGTDGSAPAGITDFDQVLERIADLRAVGLSEFPLAEFILRLRHRVPWLAVPDDWFAGQGLDPAAVDKLAAAVREDIATPRKLVIDLRDWAPGKPRMPVTGLLGPRGRTQGARRPDWWKWTVTCEPTADGVRRAVVKIVEWARALASDFAIGFLLGLSMMGELPELWEYEDEVLAPVRLCLEYPVVLHVAERMTIPQLQQVWRSKLDTLSAAAAGAPGVLWLDTDDATEIRHNVQQSDDAYVAFSFVPESHHDPRRTAQMAAVAAGAPYVIWVRSAPGQQYDLRARLTSIAVPVREFPGLLLRSRRSDPYLSDALRVIWDNTDELPPYLGRLGQELA
jgi:vWA-MoxR associated protein C-terminal domain/Caspase domain